ncbi:MAG: hypothetical protein EZS28_037278, partial [Streblomastix strix]
SLPAHSSQQQEHQSANVQVASVPTVDEQDYQSYPAEPPPQYLQAIYQQHAYQQNKIPNQNQIPTISQVPTYQTNSSNTKLNSEAMNTKLNHVSSAQSCIINEIGPIAHTAQVPSEEDTQVDGDTYTSISRNVSTILFDPLIKKGIVKFEFQSLNQLRRIGIAEESVLFKRDEYSWAKGYKKIVMYDWRGSIGHIGEEIEGNAAFNTGDRVTFEFNIDTSPRTLTFFVNDVEQPNYVSNIPAAVRAYFLFKNDAFKVLKFEALPAPTAQHSTGSRAWEYGTEWNKSKCIIQ